jgi:hypothetical protein
VCSSDLYDVYNKYDSYLEQSNGLRENTLKHFTLDNMHDRFVKLMDTYVKKQPQFVPFNIPKVNASKMQIPKLNKI